MCRTYVIVTTSGFVELTRFKLGNIWLANMNVKNPFKKISNNRYALYRGTIKFDNRKFLIIMINNYKIEHGLIKILQRILTNVLIILVIPVLHEIKPPVEKNLHV